jgi:hypothetical protein
MTQTLIQNNDSPLPTRQGGAFLFGGANLEGAVDKRTNVCLNPHSLFNLQHVIMQCHHKASHIAPTRVIFHLMIHNMRTTSMPLPSWYILVFLLNRKVGV